MPDVTAHIGIGSNLGDRHAMIDAALAALAEAGGVELTATSPVIETDPVGPADQPRYLNAAAAVRTSLSPRQLLEAILGIETALGRDRRGEQRWGPRCIDLDLLLHGDAVLDEEGLRVPHPRLHERAFVLHPLAIIAPHAIHPILGLSIECLRDRLAGGGRNTPPRRRVVEH